MNAFASDVETSTMLHLRANTLSDVTPSALRMIFSTCSRRSFQTSSRILIRRYPAASTRWRLVMWYFLSFVRSSCQYRPLNSIARLRDGTTTSSSSGPMTVRSDCTASGQMERTKLKTSVSALDTPDLQHLGQPAPLRCEYIFCSKSPCVRHVMVIFFLPPLVFGMDSYFFKLPYSSDYT